MSIIGGGFGPKKYILNHGFKYSGRNFVQLLQQRPLSLGKVNSDKCDEVAY